MPLPPFIAETAEGAVLNVRAAPRSSRAGVDGVVGDAVKVRIRAAPVDGKANRELVETLADALKLPKSRVVLKGGETSKAKRVLLVGMTARSISDTFDFNGHVDSSSVGVKP